MKTIRMTRVNGVGAVKGADGLYRVPRKVLERNVLDMLEENEKYMNLEFLEAQEITECATEYELIRIYTEEMGIDEFKAIYKRVFG